MIADLYRTPSTELLGFSWPPPLHLKLRNGNYLLNKLHEASPAVHAEYMRLAGVPPEKYHQELEGGPLTNLLQAANRLPGIITTDIRSQLEQSNVAEQCRSKKARGPLRRGSRLADSQVANLHDSHPARHFPNAFQTLSTLISLVSSKTHHSELHDAATQYQAALNQLGIVPTIMMYILVDHVPDFSAQHKCGVGFHSEESA